jgi:hypothetical protein
MRINALFPGIPYAFRTNFFHLVMDVAWWGVFNGSAVIFLPIFATRLGASPFQIGILTAIPAAMNILLTIPAGLVSQRYPIMRANLVVAVLNRALFIPFILLPFFLQANALVLAILLNVVLMNIPGAWTGILGPAFLGAKNGEIAHVNRSMPHSGERENAGEDIVHQVCDMDRPPRNFL